MYSYKKEGKDHLQRGYKILNFNIFGFFSKNEFFGDMIKLWLFLGSLQILTILQGHFYTIYVFS